MRNKVVIVAGVVLAAAAFLTAHLTAQAATIDRSRDCDKYAIVYCGTMSESEVREKYGQKDHDTVFRAFGISKSDVSGDIRKGVVYRDGRVVVGGKTVATNAVMAARHLGGSAISGSSTAKKVSVSKMGSAQEALVKFDADGEFEWAIMTPCGNPVKATPKKVKKPVYACESLSADKVARNKFEFTTDATADNGATITGYTYNFGDGTTARAGKTTTHTYTKPGTYRVSVKVSVKVGGKTVTAPGSCVTSVTVDAPDEPGVEITKYVDGVKFKKVAVNHEFDYRITVKNTGNVVLKDAVVTDPAPAGVTFLSADRGTIADNAWTYTIDELAVGDSETFTITAKLPKYQSGNIINEACVETPTVPGGNPDDCDEATVTTNPNKIKVCELETKKLIWINETEFDEALHSKDYDDCKEEKPPVELPHTGPLDTFLNVVGIGSLAGAGIAYYASRRSLG